MSASMKVPNDERVHGRMREDKGRNSRRRSRESRPADGVAAIIQGLLAEKVTKADGSQSDLTALRAIVLQLVRKSAAGDKRATKTLMRFRQRNPETRALAITVTGGLPD